MFSFFRRGATAKVMLAILGLALFAMVVTGFGTGGSGIGGLGGLGGGTLAVAGDEELGAVEVTDVVTRQLDAARQQQPELDMAAFLGGAYRSIIDQLIAAKALVSFGKEHGLAASKRLIDGEIASIPGFQNLAGEFDDTMFRQILQREGITEQQLREEIESSLIQKHLLLPVAGSARVPESMALQYASLLLERRTGSIGIVPAEAMPAGAAPTAAEVNAFYQQNRARYTIPERRVLRYAVFGPEQVAAAAQPTDAEIAAYYQANATTYGPSETRTLSQVVLPSREAAQAFVAKVSGGMSFAAAAGQAGFGAADISVGAQSREAFANLTSPAVATAAFSAAEGAVTQPTQSDFGWHVVRVDDVAATPGRTLAAVRDEIAQTLGQKKLQDALGDLVVKVEDALGEGESFAEVARANGLTIRETPPITATGAVPGSDAQLPPEVAPLLETAFAMSPDEDPLVETITQGERFAMLAVGRVIPAAPPPLADIQQQVTADLVARRAADRAREVAQAIVARINAGAAPAQAFAQADVQLPSPEGVDARRLDIAQGGQQVPPPLAMLFSMKKGTAKLLPAPNGAGWFVVHLATTEAGDATGNPALVQATRSQFGQVAGEEYAQQFTNAVQRLVGVERNEDAIQALREQLQGPGGF